MRLSHGWRRVFSAWALVLILILAGPQARNLLLRRFAKLDAYE